MMEHVFVPASMTSRTRTLCAQAEVFLSDFAIAFADSEFVSSVDLCVALHATTCELQLIIWISSHYAHDSDVRKTMTPEISGYVF